MEGGQLWDWKVGIEGGRDGFGLVYWCIRVSNYSSNEGAQGEQGGAENIPPLRVCSVSPQALLIPGTQSKRAVVG